MKDVVGERNVPIFVAKEGVELAKNWLMLFIAPSELAILKMNIFEITSIERVPESNNAAPVHISTVLVSRSIYLIEVSGHEPSCSRVRLGGDKLGIESFFEVVTSRSINGCELVGDVGANDLNIRRD
jgi:hypothetical protein